MRIFKASIVTFAVLAAIALSFNPALSVLGYIFGLHLATKAAGPLLATIVWMNPGIHVAPFNPFAGEGEQDAFLNFDVAAADRFLKAGLQPGDVFRFQEGIFLLAYNKNGNAMAQGDFVKLSVRHSTLTITAATADVLTIGAGGMVADELVGKFVFIKSGTGTGQVRRILGNTATTITVARYYPSLQLAAASSPDAFDTVAVNTDTCSIIGFDEVIKTAAATDLVLGCSKGTAADGDLGVFQIAGPCLGKLVGSTDAVTALGPIVPSGTAGVAKGFTTAGETAADARLTFGVAFDAYSGASGLRHVFLYGNKALVCCAPKIR